MNTTNNLTPETCVEDIRRAYDLYLRSGHERYELNDVSLDSMGYLLPRRLEAKLVNAMNTLSVLRPLCTEVTTAGDRALPIVNDHGKAAWVPEGHTIPMVKDAFDRVNLDSHKLAAIIRVTSELLKDSAIDIIKEFAQRIGEAEEAAFIHGDGLSKPLGIIHQLEREVITEKAGKISTDDLLDLKHAIPSKYRKDAVFLMHDSTLRELFKLRTGEGQYIWYENPKKKIPLCIFGHRVITCPSMPTIESGKPPILFGDFKHFVIGDRKHRRIKRLTEVHAQQGQVAYIMSQRVDAELLDRNAIVALKVK